MTDEQERSVDTMDEQEKRETAEAEKQYSEAGKKHTEAEMDEQERREVEEEAEQQQANEAAKQFADAVRASYQAVADRSVSAQALNAQLTQQFFTDVINNLRGQAEDNRAMTQELVDQQRRTQEAGQALTQETVDAYMDFVNSIFSFYQGSVQEEEEEEEEEEEGAEAAERGTRETDGSTGGDRVESQEAGGGGLPIEDYDSLGVKKISERLEELSDEEVVQLRRYETANKNRSTLLVRFDERLGASST